MQAIVLVGGEGTRLRPLTYGTPKPMVPIVNTPFLARTMERLYEAGIRDVILAAGYMPQAISDYFGDGSRLGMNITYVIEESPLGTAGAEDLSVLDAMVTAVGKLGRDSRGSQDHRDGHKIELEVGGLTARAERSADEHLDWIKQPLKTGDVVTIRVVDAASVDVPKRRQRARRQDAYRQQYEWAKRYYLENRDKFEGR